MLKPRNLFFLLATLAGVLALIFEFIVSPSADMPERSYLASMFIYMMGVMAAIGVIYGLMEKLNRPVSGKIAASHYLISLLAVGCGIICTITAHDGIENAAWTSIPKFFAIKLFILSVGVFFFGLVKAFIAKKPNAAIG